jgi:metal-sulfur cluster biosynthetic enzyme
MAKITQATNSLLTQVEDALRGVIDPELGLDFIELGLIYNIGIDQDHVIITYSLTSPACPVAGQLGQEIEKVVHDLDSVNKVTAQLTFDPPWQPEMMSEDAKFLFM